MNQAELQEIVSSAGITQGTNSVNLHAVLYSTADKNMVYFVKHVQCFVRNEYVLEAEQETLSLCD